MSTLVFTQISFAEPISDVSPKPREEEKVQREKVPEKSLENPPEPIVPENIPGEIDTEKALKNTFFLYQLQQDLKNSTSDYRSSSALSSAAQEKLTKTRENLSTLRQQILLFDSQMQESEKKMLNVADQIASKQQEINAMSEEIEARKRALDEQKALLQSYIKMQYVQENSFFETGSNGPEISTAKILFSDRSLSDTVDEVNAVSLFQQAGVILLEKLQEDMKIYEGLQLNVQSKKNRLDALQQKLEGEKQNLDDQKFSKAQLLTDTHGDEQRYQQLMEESLAQQEESILAIRALQDNMNYVQRKLQDFGSNVSYADLKNIVDQRTKEFYEYQSQQDTGEFQWPVQPTRGISAFFQDNSYKARFGVVHNAIDIPTPQGTPIRAPKDGYIYKTKDNGLGYNYIIMSHKDNFTTVYGHVSQILVAENDFVKAGTIIGLAGGTPGTQGAGHMTTGAHLHFEIHKNGYFVDPLEYLSLTKLPLESLPERYIQRIETQRRPSPAILEGTEGPIKMEEIGDMLEKSEELRDQKEESSKKIIPF